MLDGRPLEACQGSTKLLIGTPIDPSSHGAQERVERERDHAISRSARFLVAVHEFDVDVLIERSRKPLARRREDSPTGMIVAHECQRAVFGGVAQPKYGNRLEPLVEKGSARGSAPAGNDGHGLK